MKKFIILMAFLANLSCTNGDLTDIFDNNSDNADTSGDNTGEATSTDFYLGADLSYVNEMLDCGAVYKDINGDGKNPYIIFNEAGANLTRVRLWNDPDSGYSNVADVENTIRAAKNNNMKILLDFHYSDHWADPEHQKIPQAWESQVNNTQALGQLLYDFTYNTLIELDAKGLTPDIVQVGNEINIMILQQEPMTFTIDWARNSALLNKGLEAVRAAASTTGKTMESMLHIAQPDNAIEWFRSAKAAGVSDYDWIGLSYYPKFSRFTVDEIAVPINSLIVENTKKLMVVETAYPFTLENNDAVSNNVGENDLIPGYPATQAGQLRYLNDLTNAIRSANGKGLIYWEPAWITNDCPTSFSGTNPGSHWDNAALFDFDGIPTDGMQFYGNMESPNACRTKFILGEALVEAGWSWETPIVLPCDNTIQSVITSFQPGAFRLFGDINEWNSSLNYTYFINEGYTIDTDLTNDNSEDQNFLFNGTAGLYKITIDNAAKTIDFAPSSEAENCVDNWVLGNAIVNTGWSWDTPAFISCDTNNVQSGTIEMQPGIFRFFTTQNIWSSSLNYAYFENNGYTIDADLSNDGTADQNFSFQGALGDYRITIDNNNKTIDIEPISNNNNDETCTTNWVLGAAIVNTGWSWDSPAFISCENNIQSGTIEIQTGAFRLFTVQNDWGSGLNYSYYADNGYTIDTDLTNDGSTDQNFYFEGATGEYRLTIDNTAKTIDIEPLANVPCNTNWVLGDAIVNSGWSWDSPAYVACENTILAGVIEIKTGSFRLFTIQGDWTSGLSYAYFIENGYTIDTDLSNDGSVDQNFRFEGTTGDYSLVIDQTLKTIEFSPAN